MKTLPIVLASTMLLAAMPAFAGGRHSPNSSHGGSSASATASARAASNASLRNTNKAAASIGGAGLAASDDTCQGSFYFNAVGGIAGLGFGKTYDVTFCKKIKQAEAMRRYGYHSVALRILLQDPDIAKAWNQAYEANQRRK